MTRKLPSHRRIKAHLNYTLEEVAKICGVTKKTVRRWIKSGELQICNDKRRPPLVLGRALAAYLFDRSKRRRFSCAPGELPCFRCGMGRAPAGGVATYRPQSSTRGILSAACTHCLTPMFLFSSPAGIVAIRSQIDVRIATCLDHISEDSGLVVNGQNIEAESYA